MDKKQHLLSRFSRMKIGLTNVLHRDEHKSNTEEESAISSLTTPITLTLTSDNLYHNSLIAVEGCPSPTELPCIIRWYNCPSNDELSQIYTSTKSLTFQPNVQDANTKIYCQWFPIDEGDDTSTLLPSKLAERGPLKRNPGLVQDAQSILNEGKGAFDIVIPQISHQKHKLVIEGTKIHIYIDSQHFNSPSKESKGDSELNISNDELKFNELEFDNTIMDVTMTRFTNSMSAMNENKDINTDTDTQWMQTYRIKPEYCVALSRANLLKFQIDNGRGSVMLRALAATSRERDILAIVIQALADAKKKRKEKKKRSHDLVQVRIDVIDDSNNQSRVAQMQKIHKLQTKMSVIHQRMLEFQKDNIYLGSEREKYVKDLNRLREAGLLKRDEMNKLSEQNMFCESEIGSLKGTMKELKQIIEEMESDKLKCAQEMRDLGTKNEDTHSKELIYKTEIDALTKKLELRDSKIAEYEMEIANLEDDRNELRKILNDLNANYDKSQLTKSQMDQDFGSLNEEKIKYKREARQFEKDLNKKTSQFDTLQIDYENLEKKWALEKEECAKLKQVLVESEIERKEMNEQMKQMKLLKIKLNDIQFEIAKKDENIQRLQIEAEHLRSDLKAENTENTKNGHKIRHLTKRLDKASTKNAKLQSQIDEFEDRVTDSVARPLYNELSRELEDYKSKLSDMIRDRDGNSTQMQKLKQLNADFKQMIDKLTRENESSKEEMSELQTHNTFWKNKVKSMREEIKKLHTIPVPLPLPTPMNRNTPSPVNSMNGDINGHKRHNIYPKSDNDISLRHDSDRDNEEKNRYQKIEKEKNEALLVVSQLKRALNNELHKANKVSIKNKMLYSHTNEEVKTLVKKNTALKTLANELADTVADKAQNMMHLKKVMKLLGTRVTELERVNKGLRRQINSVDHEINVLEHTHSNVKEEEES